MSDEGSDDSPPRPKRKIKKVLLLSSSDSESDENISVAGARRKRLRVLSDDEASDSSGSSVVRAGTRRSRTLPKLRDSDADSDSSAWDTDDASKPLASTTNPISGFASDSSEGNSDKCSICLLRFKDQLVGIPENCEHIFCLDCITEWSKNVNTCPVDRITFNSIVVKACATGRVLRTEPVKVIERRPSIESLLIEDLTMCEICGSSEDEDRMLLCDGCDLGYHMNCLSPPLIEIPPNQWLCPNCDVSHSAELDLLDDINLSEVEDLFEGVNDIDLPLRPRPVALRQPRNVRRSSRNVSQADQPSTSSGLRGNSINELAITRGSRGTQRGTTRATNRRRGVTKSRKYKRRRTRTVIIEYEVMETGKFPITKRVKKKLKRRRVKKQQPRTAARRSHVRASVRAKLATQSANQRVDLAQVSNAGVGVVELSVRRQRAGIPSLSILGNRNELVYFSDEDTAMSEEASTAVAARPTSNILSAYRQARRKMVTVPSPPYASSAPDILSNILESQTLLHSKNSIISVSFNGNVDYKLTQTQKRSEQKNDVLVSKNKDKVDLTKSDEAVKNVPSYPGQNRGGWGGGYRGNYHREQNSNNFNRGNNYDNNYGGGYPNRQGNSFNNYQNNNMRRDDTEYYDNFPRRQQPFTPTDDAYYDRSRRPGPMDNNRGTNYPNNQRPNEQSQGQGRFSLGPTWQPYGGSGHPGNSVPPARSDLPPAPSRHSFGGFENPVDMRMGQMPPTNTNINTYSNINTIEAPRQEKSHPQAFQTLSEPQAYQPMSEAPVFNFQKLSEVEKSEDERSDPGLIIDTEKYDPTEPTNDDDSGDEDKVSVPGLVPSPSAPAPPFVAPPAPAAAAPAPAALAPPAPALPAPPPPPPAVQSILAGIDTSSMNVPPSVLDTAVRQVLKEHRNLIVPSTIDSRDDKSDDDSDGDCPNFSIYSATSVHIANNSSSMTEELPKEQPQDSLEDLVQEDDETPPSTSPVALPDVALPDAALNEKRSDAIKLLSKSVLSNYESEEKKKSDDEYKEKISKRCPITTNTRNPIKIKLNTPSLIKRQVSLYDEEEISQELELTDNAETTPEGNEDKLKCNNNTAYQSTPDICEDKVESNEIFAENDCEAKSGSLVKVDSKDYSDKKPEVVQNKIIDSIVNLNSEVLSKHDNEIDKLENIDSKTSLDKSSKKDMASEDKEDEHSDGENDVSISVTSRSPDYDENARCDDNIEKMTESISETEDERSYTPCLDENKSNKDASFENDKDKGLEGLDTEMISEDEGNEMFSENERPPSEASRASPPRAKVESEEGELADKKKEVKKVSTREESTKKKKKKDSKKESKEKGKNKKRSEVSFKKLSKSGKERNYRERDKNERRSERERRNSTDANESRQRRRKEKRKDLERYDVRTVVTEKRRKQKDPFGRDVSPRRSASPSLSARSPSRRRSLSARSPARRRRSLSRRSPSRPRRSPSPRRSPPARRSLGRRISPPRGRSPSPARGRRSASSLRRRSGTPRLSPLRRSPPRRKRRRSGSRAARRRSVGASPPRRANKKKKRPRPARRAPEPSPERKRRRSASRQPSPSPPSPMSRPPSPRTPPPDAAPDAPAGPRSDDEPERRERRRRDPDRPRRRPRDALGPSKEVFTSGDNILVSVSFKEQERGEDGDRRRRRETRRDRRRRRRAAAAPELETAKPVAIIDLDRSPFRELTPSPKNVIVLSDSEPGERDGAEAAAPPLAPAEPAPEAAAPALGPKTPPEPEAPPAAAPEPEPAAANEPESGPPSPDAYDPFEPTRSPSASPAAAAPEPSPPRALITLEAAQRSNLSADEVLDRRPLTPVEKVMALLQSTRDASPEPAEAEAPVPRIVLPSPTRAAAKLFPGKPSPIKSNPVKPMQALRLPRAPSDGGASPYSPGSGDFGDLFEPPPRRRARSDRKRGKTQPAGKLDDDNPIFLSELPNFTMQAKNKASRSSSRATFLRKLNRQERVVEEVKLVLKPHYTRKRVTKDEYKDILRRAVPKICHNKSGEINPTKIQALVEAYVKKFRKKHKLGIA